MILAGARSAQAQTKLWCVRLETRGWKDPFDKPEKPKSAAPASSSQHHARFTVAKKDADAAPYDPDLDVIWRQELVVDAQGQVFVGFGMRGSQPNAPKALRVVTFEGQHGAVARQIDLPTPMLDRTAVFLSGNDGLLVVAGDRVQRINGDGAVGNSIPIPPQPAINPGLWVKQSPTGQTLLLTTDDKAFTFVNAESLATVAECHKDNDEIETLNDKMALSMAENAHHDFELHSGPLCGSMPMLWSLSGSRSSNVHLLEDGSVLEVGSQLVRRLTLDDKPLWSWKAPHDLIPEDVDGLPISRDGSRVAVQLTAFRVLRFPGCIECTGPEFESWGVGIVVFNAATGHQVAVIPVDDASLNRLAFALSPDGHKLAVLNGSLLELWAL